MLREFTLIVGNERFEAVDLVNGEDQPILVVWENDDRLCQDQDGLRVENVMVSARNQADTERFERFSFEELSQVVLNHEAPFYALCAGKRSTRAISLSHIHAR
jgi:hypothetical protein